jgi:hypothetical protein
VVVRSPRATNKNIYLQYIVLTAARPQRIGNEGKSPGRSRVTNSFAKIN